MPLLILGLFLLVCGCALAFSSARNLRRRRRILATPTSTIARAPGGAPVEIKGHIVPSEEGVLRSPFSGREVVWFRIVVQEHRSQGRSGSWRTVADEQDGRAFLVDDGSGQQARVVPAGAHVTLGRRNVATSGTFRDTTATLEAFLRSRGLTSTTWLGLNKSMRFEEEVLAPGDQVYALGPSHRIAGPPVHDGYRMTPATQLLLRHEGPDAGELILTNKTEGQLTHVLLIPSVVGVAMIVVSLALLLAGVSAL